jgi:hypothetical protein
MVSTMPDGLINDPERYMQWAAVRTQSRVSSEPPQKELLNPRLPTSSPPRTRARRTLRDLTRAAVWRRGGQEGAGPACDRPSRVWGGGKGAGKEGGCA